MSHGMRTLWLGVVLLLALICSGCPTAKRIRYVHEPTQGLYKELDLDRKGLDEFSHDGVVVWPHTHFLTTGTKLLLCAASKQQKPVAVKRARLNGIGDKASIRREYAVDETIDLAEQRKPGIFRSSVTLSTIDNAELHDIGAGGGLRLEVVFRVGGAGADITKIYEIKRRETTHMVTH